MRQGRRYGLSAEQKADTMKITELRSQTERPRFERRGLHLLMLFWGIAVRCWSPVFLYARHHPNVSGELDLGGAGITTICMIISAIFALCGLTALAHATVSFLWRRLRDERGIF
jgi:hypothetical protein